MILLETKRTSAALTGRIRVLAGDGLMLLLVLSCGRCLVTVCAYVYTPAIMDLTGGGGGGRPVCCGCLGKTNRTASDPFLVEEIYVIF